MDETVKAKLKEMGLESVVTAFEKMATDLQVVTEAKATAEKLVTEKDGIIAQKTDDIVQLRKSSEKEYTKLKDMTDAEKATLSDKEKELLERQERLESEQETFRAQQAESLAKEVTARRGRAFEKLIGTKDPELRKKMEDAFGKIKDSDKAQTDEEIAAVAQSAFNMLGVPRPEGVRQAINESGGGTGGIGGDGNFAESKEGKDLSGAMGLPTEAAPAAGGAGA